MSPTVNQTCRFEYAIGWEDGSIDGVYISPQRVNEVAAQFPEGKTWQVVVRTITTTQWAAVPE